MVRFPWGDLVKGVNGDLEVEPIFNDLLVRLISLAIVSKTQKKNIGANNLGLNTGIMLLFRVVLCVAEVCSPHFHPPGRKMRAILNKVIYFKFIFLIVFFSFCFGNPVCFRLWEGLMAETLQLVSCHLKGSAFILSCHLGCFCYKLCRGIFFWHLHPKM